MPRPMKFKIFMDTKPHVIEELVDAWLNKLGTANIIKTETVVTTIAEKQDGGTYPCIVVSIWYEPSDTN
jgi:hypothetical protein